MKPCAALSNMRGVLAITADVSRVSRCRTSFLSEERTGTESVIVRVGGGGGGAGGLQSMRRLQGSDYRA